MNEFEVRDVLREKRQGIKDFDELMAYIKKNCNNCANCVYGEPDALYCVDCWKQSNWQPNEHTQRIILAAETKKYIKEDTAMAKTSYKHFVKNGESIKNTIKVQFNKNTEMDIRDNIKDVIFSDPATIILWKDGSKTVVKTQDVEAYDPEKGFAMAIAKKVLGGQGNYYEVFKKWVPDVDVVANTVQFELKLMPDLSAASEYIHEIQKKLYEDLRREDKTEE